MAGRSANSATALRRLMTEYKQLTAGGMSSNHTQTTISLLTLLTGSPDGMFTAGMLPNMSHLRHTKPYLAIGPISESDFFTWEALISGPKDTPFVCQLTFRIPYERFIHVNQYIPGRWYLRS